MKKVLSKQMAKTRIESHFALMNLSSSLKNSMELLYLAKFYMSSCQAFDFTCSNPFKKVLLLKN